MVSSCCRVGIAIMLHAFLVFRRRAIYRCSDRYIVVVTIVLIVIIVIVVIIVVAVDVIIVAVDIIVVVVVVISCY